MAHVKAGALVWWALLVAAADAQVGGVRVVPYFPDELYRAGELRVHSGEQ